MQPLFDPADLQPEIRIAETMCCVTKGSGFDGIEMSGEQDHDRQLGSNLHKETWKVGWKRNREVEVCPSTTDEWSPMMKSP